MRILSSTLHIGSCIIPTEQNFTNSLCRSSGLDHAFRLRQALETAFQDIEVHEEYVLLRFMGPMPAQQSMSTKNGHS